GGPEDRGGTCPCGAAPGARGGAGRDRTDGFLSGMSFPFNGSTKSAIADRCAAFVRAPSDPAQALQHAAVAITLTPADAGSGETTLLLTGRVAGLRSHGGQWALPGGRIDAGETP